jgi:hypothetical protein
MKKLLGKRIDTMIDVHFRHPRNTLDDTGAEKRNDKKCRLLGAHTRAALRIVVPVCRARPGGLLFG